MNRKLKLSLVEVNIYGKNPPKITKLTSKINVKVGAGKKQYSEAKKYSEKYR